MTLLRRAALLILAWAAVTGHATGQIVYGPTPVQAPRDAEAVARLFVRCTACAWDVEGREGATLAVHLDERPPVHVPVVRQDDAPYEIMLGRVEAGAHRVRVEVVQELTARALRTRGAVSVTGLAVDLFTDAEPGYLPRSLAPIVHARADTVGRFTDVPVFMWYETEADPRGTRYRYSVVFTNEDGGTPTDRLMATWGRTTDIEYMYSVVVDAEGRIVADDYQGPEHETLPFRGTREGSHPLLWVATQNNMVRDEGETRVRYAPAPRYFPLIDVSREAVMDANPWLYAVMSQELAREGKIVPDAPPGRDAIPDPRLFAYIEACGELGTSALAFALRVGDEWIASDRSVAAYRIVRDGCFRAAIPLPPETREQELRGLRAQAYERAVRDGAPVEPATPVRLTRINTVFMLDEGYRPGAPRFRWEGARTLVPGGEPAEFVLP